MLRRDGVCAGRNPPSVLKIRYILNSNFELREGKRNCVLTARTRKPIKEAFTIMARGIKKVEPAEALFRYLGYFYSAYLRLRYLREGVQSGVRQLVDG